MCVNKIKQAAKQAVNFIFDNTNLDYQISVKCIQYALKLYGRLDTIEKTNFIKNLEEATTICKANLNILKEGGDNE